MWNIYDNCYAKNIAYLNIVRFQFLTATGMKMTVFWNVAPCSLLDIDQFLKDHLHQDNDMLEPVRSSETSVGVYQAAWRRFKKTAIYFHISCFILTLVYIGLIESWGIGLYSS
jgi:hypothetical protein